MGSNEEYPGKKRRPSHEDGGAKTLHHGTGGMRGSNDQHDDDHDSNLFLHETGRQQQQKQEQAVIFNPANAVLGIGRQKPKTLPTSRKVEAGYAKTTGDLMSAGGTKKQSSTAPSFPLDRVPSLDIPT